MLARTRLAKLRKRIMRRDRKYSVDDPDCYDDDGGEGEAEDDDDDGDTVAGDVIGEGIGIDEDEMERFAVMRRVTPSPPPAPRQGWMDGHADVVRATYFNFMLW